MADLILRRTGLKDPALEFALELRYHGPVETDYWTLRWVSRSTAEEIVNAGACTFLYSNQERAEDDPERRPKEEPLTFAERGLLMLSNALYSTRKSKAAYKQLWEHHRANNTMAQYYQACFHEATTQEKALEERIKEEGKRMISTNAGWLRSLA